MRLDITKALHAPGQEFPFQLEMEMEDLWLSGECVQFTGPAVLTGIFAGAGESVFIRGTIRAALSATCARCLASVTHRVEAAVEETFVRTPDPDAPEQNVYEGFTLDLTEPSVTALVLSLPMRFLCTADCAGLCPTCGADLNERTCPCQKEMPPEHPFSALQQLLTKDEEV